MQEEGPVYIQMCSALVMQMIQSTAELPAVDVDGETALKLCSVASTWADHFWKSIMDRYGHMTICRPPLALGSSANSTREWAV